MLTVPPLPVRTQAAHGETEARHEACMPHHTRGPPDPNWVAKEAGTHPRTRPFPYVGMQRPVSEPRALTAACPDSM